MAPRARPAPSHTIAAGCAFKLVELAEAAGVGVETLRRVELPPATAHGFETRIPYEKQLELWEVAMRALRDPGFPIAVAARLRPSDYSVVGFAWMTCANLREALEQAVRYSSIWTDANRWELSECDRAVTLRFVDDGSDRLGTRCNTECAVAEMIHSGRALIGIEASPDAVHFRHAPPPDTSAHEAFFGSPVRFGAARNEIVFDSRFLDTPLTKADPDLAAYFQRHTEVLLRRCTRPQSVAERLEAVLVEDLARGSPTLETSAARLGMSARTLRRRLLEEGTRFQDVLVRARCSLAKRYLVEPKLALGEVAFLLGFSEPSAFHRAFKRWTGQTPLAFRGHAGQRFGRP